MLLLNIHNNGKSFKSVNFLLRSRQLASFDSLNKIHFPRSQLILCTFLFPNLQLCGTAATGQKKRSNIVLLHVLTATPAWLHCSHLLFSPPPFSHSPVWKPLFIFAERSHCSRLRGQFSLWSTDQCCGGKYFLGNITEVDTSISLRAIMLCSTDSFSFLQKLQLNVSSFSLELLPHVPPQSPRLLSSVNTFPAAPVPVQCCSSRTRLRGACGTLQILETTSHWPTSGSGRSLLAATCHSDKGTAAASPWALQ